MRYLVVIVVVSSMSVAARGPTRKVDFEHDVAGQPPDGFAFGQTRKAGAPGRWVVQQDGGGKYLAQVDADETRNRFPVAVIAVVSAANVDLSVRFRPVSGRVDQAAGLVWRYQTRTTITSSAPTRSRTTWCSTRWRTGDVRSCR